MYSNCIGCGLCEAMCHKQAISIQENRSGSFCKVDKKLCDHCGICSKLCPVEQIQQREDLNISQQVMIGRSKNINVVKKSASGGIVSEILIHLFQTGEIQAAIVAFYDEHANIYGDIIDNKNDVLNHSGSYYHTSKQLINVKKISQYKKVALVGLPCHIEGIINYCNLTHQDVFKIALFCSIGRTYAGFRHFFKNQTGFDISTGKIKKYLSRYGEKKLIRIEDISGNIYECPDELYKFKTDFFWINKTCLKCKKMYGLSADISIGDAWHRITEKKGVKEKMAIISANTTRGGVLLDSLKNLLLERVANAAFELVSSQRFGASLKQIHNKNLVKKLGNLRFLRSLNNNALLFRVNCKIRAMLMQQLERDSKKLAEDIIANSIT